MEVYKRSTTVNSRMPPIEITSIVGITSKQLHHFSATENNFMEFYNNNVNDGASLPEKEESNINSFHRVMRSVMVTAQCFALCPIIGISSPNVEDLRFTWLSWRVFYSFVIIFGMLAAIGFNIAYYVKGFFSFNTSGKIVLYIFGFLCNILFLKLSQSWPALQILWQKTEKSLFKYGCPKKFSVKIKLLAILALILSLAEYVLDKYTVISMATLCSDSYEDVMKRYSWINYNFVFQFVTFSAPAMIIFEIIHSIAIFYWNFIDIFIICVSLGISSRFRLLNNSLSLIMGKVKTEMFWRVTREDYTSLSSLTKSLDSSVSSIVLLSFASNMFNICLLLYNSMKKSTDIVKTIYFLFSFGYLLLRTTAVALSAASIYDESKATKNFLYSVPAHCYKMEVHRFIIQISTDTVALSGLNFFTVTRSLLLTLGGTVVTYVVVMVQFSGTSDSQSSNSTQLCLNITT